MKNKLFRYLLPGILLAGYTLPAYSQGGLPYVFASGGGTAAAAGGNRIDFTVGETFIATVGSSTQLTQGFQQPTTSGTPLGVQLLDFTGTAKKDYNFLSWHTAFEKNNDRFVLERSADGLDFTPVATVYSKATGGYSTAELLYTYTDKTMTAPVNYYRLQQTDRDGVFTYSAVVRLERNNTEGNLFVTPNPTRDKAVLHVEGAWEHARVQLANITGRILWTTQVTAKETTVDLGAYAPGIYFIRYEDGQRTESVKVVKQ